MAGTSSTKPNKNYSEEIKIHKRAWIHGTLEYKKRNSYPGEVAQCDTDECINNVKNESGKCYWLCEDCCKLVPDIREYYIHSPSKNHQTNEKVKRHSVFVFIAHLQNKYGKNNT